MKLDCKSVVKCLRLSIQKRSNLDSADSTNRTKFGNGFLGCQSLSLCDIHHIPLDGDSVVYN